LVLSIVKTEIEILKRELYSLLEQGVDFSEVYELSVKLDKLILEYYYAARA
jgi:hypothetical protein